MRWTYDIQSGAAYVYLRDEQIDHQVVLTDGRVIADVTSTGALVGLEILSLPVALPASELADLGLDDDDLSMARAVASATFPRSQAAPAAPIPEPPVFRSEAELELSVQ